MKTHGEGKKLGLAFITPHPRPVPLPPIWGRSTWLRPWPKALSQPPALE